MGSLSFMLAEIDKSSQALDQAVTGAVRQLRQDNMESVERSFLVFITYTFGSLFLILATTLSTTDTALAVAFQATGATVFESGYIYEVYKDIKVTTIYVAMKYK